MADLRSVIWMLRLVCPAARLAQQFGRRVWGGTVVRKWDLESPLEGLRTSIRYLFQLNLCQD